MLIQLSTGDVVNPEEIDFIIARSVDPDHPVDGAQVIIGTQSGPFVMRVADMAEAAALRDSLLADIEN